MIYGSRLRQARELRGSETRQSAIAAALGVSTPTVSRLESGVLPTIDQPGGSKRLAELFLLPPGFFEAPIIEALPEGSLLRARRSLTKRQLNQVRAEAQLAHEIATRSMEFVSVPDSRIPAMSPTSSPGDVARVARSALGLEPSGPVSAVMRPLERAGVLIYRIQSTVDLRLDAFSTWVGDRADRPIIAIGDHMPWDRERMTLSHELAHLVLHRSVAGDPERERQIERDADRFAGAFLLPDDDAREILPYPVTLARLLPIKLEWGISVAALVARAAELEMISRDESRWLNIQISKRGWRRDEPGHDARPNERPRALRHMVELAYGNPVNYRRLAKEVGRYESDVRSELERYAPAPRTRAVPSDPWRPPGRKRTLDATVVHLRQRGS